MYPAYTEYEAIVHRDRRSGTSMCYVIVTCRSVTWTLMTIASTVVITLAAISPNWLIGPVQYGSTPLDSTAANTSVVSPSNQSTDAEYRRTIGIFNLCTRVQRYAGVRDDSCAVYVTGFSMSSEQFPDAWKSTLILLALALVLLAFTDLTALFSLCIQSIFKKSIFTVSGLIQSLAALFLVVGQVLYPAGWSAKRVKDLCGDKAGPFLIDRCHIGWAYFTCMAGTVLLFICALLSIQAENSTSSDKVERKIMDGKQVICVV